MRPYKDAVILPGNIQTIGLSKLQKNYWQAEASHPNLMVQCTQCSSKTSKDTKNLAMQEANIFDPVCR